MSNRLSVPSIPLASSVRDGAAPSFVGPDVSKSTAVAECVREYRSPSRSTQVKQPPLWSRILRPLRRPKALKRVLDNPANGSTVDHFRKLLERAGCNVESVDHSGDSVAINFVFLDDEGRCTAFLTDRLRDGSYLRCNIVARVGLELPLDQVNKLNRYSKFLRFYNIRNNSLFIEYSFVLVDLPDSAVLANVEVFHGSIVYIVSNGFEYAGMNDVPSGANRACAPDSGPTWTRVEGNVTTLAFAVSAGRRLESRSSSKSQARIAHMRVDAQRKQQERLKTAEDFHAATKRLFEEAKPALAEVLKEHEMEISLGTQKDSLDEWGEFGDYGWVMVWRKPRGDRIPLAMCFGFAVRLATGEIIHGALCPELEPQFTWCKPDDIFDFETLLEIVKDELPQVA
jgi:hypothetical protein